MKISRIIAFINAGICVLLLSACGFHLRGNANLPFQTLYVDASPGSTFGNGLRREIIHGSTSTITDTAKGAQAIVHVVSEDRGSEILSLTTSGRVQELSLYYRLAYRVTDGDNNKEFTPKTTISLRRDLTYSDTDVIAIGQEEDLLYKDMQTDAIRQIVRRLQAIRPANAQPISTPIETPAPNTPAAPVTPEPAPK